MGFLPPAAGQYRVEKRKWDGSVAARWPARVFAGDGVTAWVTAPGALRERPRRGTREVVRHPEAAASCGRWWVVTATATPEGVRHLVDAAISPVRRDGVLAWIDLDLDVDPALPGVEDEDQFHVRAREMGYPLEVCRGAWTGLRDAVGRHVRGEWPFDGSLDALLAREAGPGNG